LSVVLPPSAHDQELEQFRADAGAPIVLVTGLPGDGKTLFALSEFAFGKQGVKQCGIPGCTLPAFDAANWMTELGAGETGIVDEAQDVFPPRSPTQDPPPHYVLNKIRHGGRALVLITQHPGMLDSRVRRLVGRHVHIRRMFGADRAVAHNWTGKIGDVETCADSDRQAFVYPKKVYSLYKSAELHRPRAKAPLKVRMIPWLVGAVVVLLLLGAWIIYSLGSSLTQGGLTSSDKPAPSAASSVKSLFGAGGSNQAGRAPVTEAEYFSRAEPRIPGMPHTAPMYDEVTKPVRAPMPSACMATKTRCTCFTQQATQLNTPEATCRSIVAGGFFVDFEDADAKNARDLAQRKAEPAQQVIQFARSGEPVSSPVFNRP
jgi:zona occludens toxin